MIKCVIFDLDICIFDTRSLGPTALDPVLSVLYEAELPRHLKRQISYALWHTSLHDIATQFQIPDDLFTRLRAAHGLLRVSEDATTFGDEAAISDLDVVRLLVTTGMRQFQEAKLLKLGIARLFHQVIIDATDDPTQTRGKTQIFSDIIVSNHRWSAEVLVVGDNPSSELAAARALGMPAVQTLRPTIEKWNGADFHITDLRDLKRIVAYFADRSPQR